MAGPNTPFFYRSGGGSSSSGSGGTGKNYLTAYKASTGSGAANTGNGDLELGATTGFSLGNVGTLTNGIPTGTTPTFGSGANGNLSLAIASTSTLGGLYSIDMISAAATTAGDCIATSAFNIDAEDQAKVLSFKIAYKAQTNPTNGNWSGTSSNSYGVAVWDATNSVFLGVAGQFNFTQSSGIGYATGTVQTGSTTASMRLMIYNVSASSGAITLRTDDWSIGPQTSPMAPAIDDWVAYNPTFTGYGSPTSVNFFSRRVGDSLEVQGQFICGTSTATPNAISVGYKGVASNVTIDTAKIVVSTSCGYAQNSVSSTTFFGLGVIAANVTTKDVTLTLQTSTANPQAGSLNGSTVASTGQTFNLWFRVPIVGWSSNSVSSADTDTRVISFSGSQATQAVTANVTDIAFTASVDRAGAWNGTQFVVPVSGDYLVCGSFVVSANGTGQVYKTGAAYLSGLWATAAAANAASAGSILVEGCKAGDTLSVRCATSITVTQGTIGIFRLSGPAVITATESVNARYFASSSTPGTSGTPLTITFTTKDFDSHNAYSAGTYTIPVSGKYQINSSCLQTAATTAANQIAVNFIYKNGTAVAGEQTYFSSSTSKPISTPVSDIISCVAGDLITIRAGNDATTPAMTANNFQNYFSIARVGN